MLFSWHMYILGLPIATASKNRAALNSELCGSTLTPKGPSTIMHILDARNPAPWIQDVILRSWFQAFRQIRRGCHEEHPNIKLVSLDSLLSPRVVAKASPPVWPRKERAWLRCYSVRNIPRQQRHQEMSAPSAFYPKIKTGCCTGFLLRLSCCLPTVLD